MSKIYIKYSLHNKKFFLEKKKNYKNIILTEFNKWQGLSIINSYLSYTLSKIYKAKIVCFPGYDHNFSKNFFSILFNKIFWVFNKIYPLKSFLIYKSFGCSDIIMPNLTFEQKLRSKKLFFSNYKKLKFRKDVINLKLNKIYIGDLVYNSFLKEYKNIYFDVADKEFRYFFFKIICLFIFWEDYLKNNPVKSIVIYHSVYIYSVLSRIALKYNIRVYSGSHYKVFKFSKKNLCPWIDFKNYKKTFHALSKSEKNRGLNVAKKEINLRFKGDMRYFDSYKESPFLKKRNDKYIKENKNIKILVASHCFFDSPVVYGKMLFNEFSDWLNFLGELSEKTNYDWYIKTHYTFNIKSREEIIRFVNKYKKFNLLPEKISHHSIIKSKIDLALTCYGSIAWEYPYFKIPVINASVNNPHVNYRFCVTPKSILEYRNLLLNLDRRYLNSIKIRSPKEIYEYYFMNFIYFKKFWLVEKLKKEDAESLFHKFSTMKAFTNDIYEDWITKFSIKNHYNIIKNLEFFIKSNKNLMI